MLTEAIEAARSSGLSPEEVHRVLGALRGIHGFIDPTASVHPSATVWHYSVILGNVVIGEGVSIGSHCEIGRGCRIGARSRIGSFTFLPPNTVIGEDTFIGPHVAMSDDMHPKVRSVEDGPYDARPPVIGNRVAVGLGAVLLPNITIGDDARIAAGAIVTKDVMVRGFVRGEPARARSISTASQEAWR